MQVNGSLTKRVPANLNVMFGSIEGEAILMDLSFKGICVSTGSACSATDLRASYVLKAIGLDKNKQLKLKNYSLISSDDDIIHMDKRRELDTCKSDEELFNEFEEI